jgi:TonB family protein
MTLPMRLISKLLVFFILAVATSVFGQGAPDSSPMFVCNPKNPSPCATPPQALSSPDPKYTKAARKAKIQGHVILWLVVSPSGVPENIRVQRSLEPGLDQNAVDAVRKWRFKPAAYEGKPVAVQINVDVRFSLDDGSSSPDPKVENSSNPPVAAPGFDSKFEGRRYISATLGMSITLPDGWLVAKEEVIANKPAIALFAKQGSLASLLLAHEHLEVTPENYLRLMQNLMGKQEGYVRLGESAVKQDGIDGVRWNSTWMRNGIRYRVTLEFFSVGDDHFRIIAAAPEDNFDRYAGSLNDFVKSVAFPALHISPEQLLP